MSKHGEWWQQATCVAGSVRMPFESKLRRSRKRALGCGGVSVRLAAAVGYRAEATIGGSDGSSSVHRCVIRGVSEVMGAHTEPLDGTVRLGVKRERPHATIVRLKHLTTERRPTSPRP